MQKADKVLSILIQNSKRDGNYIFKRVYRNLYNKDFYLNAYAKIYAKEGNMTEGVDGKTIDGFKLEMVEKLIEKLKMEQYYPKPVRRMYIPKKNGKMRPLGIPSFEDKLLGEVIRQILEAIYEPTFSENSHGFRLNKSCHTALHQVKTKARGSSWVIEGDITGCFDNIDHDILLEILSRKIKDGRFINLIRRYLKAGHFEFNHVHNSLSGCPQGSLISPILSNIYLNEFDKYMDELIKRTQKGKKKKINPEYKQLSGKRERAMKKGNKELAQKMLKEMQKIPSVDHMDENFIRITYVRYCDDFVICISGNKLLASKIKEDITEFLKVELKLELNSEKTLITNLKNGRARFLGYEFTKTISNTKIKKCSNGMKKRSINGTIQLLVPSKVINEKIKPFMKNKKPHYHGGRVNIPILDMITQYNSEIRGLYNYYCLATDVSRKLYKFKYYHYYSLIKTIARKEKASVKKTIAKYGIDVPRKVGTGTRKVLGIKYNTKQGTKTMTYFNDSMKKKDMPIVNVKDRYGAEMKNRSQLLTRLNANICELCGSEENIEVHHIRKLKDIKDKYKKRGKIIPNWILTMAKMNRKTLVVCQKCHKNIHGGK